MRGSETTNWKVYLMSRTWHLAVIGSPTTAGSQCSWACLPFRRLHGGESDNTRLIPLHHQPPPRPDLGTRPIPTCLDISTEYY